MDLWSICISTTQNAQSVAMTSAPLVPITATTVKHNTNATNVALSGMNKGKVMQIQTFINEFKLTFVYDLLRQTLTDEQLFEHSVENGQVIWFKEQMRQMWLMWEKAQAVPEVINVGNELQSWVAVWSFKARHDHEDYIVVDANLLAEKIEKLTGANA